MGTAVRAGAAPKEATVGAPRLEGTVGGQVVAGAEWRGVEPQGQGNLAPRCKLSLFGIRCSNGVRRSRSYMSL